MPASIQGKPVQRWLGRHGHRVFHPLAGADLATLAALVRADSRLTARGALRLALAFGAAGWRLPFDVLEKRRHAALHGQGSPMPPPVFIVGHWRSGTTHVHNVLSQAPRFGTVPPLAVGLPWRFLGLSRFWRSRFEECLPPDRIIDPVPVAPTSPQEDELALANMQPLSFFAGIFLPRRLRERVHRGVFFDGCSPCEIALWQARLELFLRKAGALAGGRRLLLKNPAHTARVPYLTALWSEARFIHVVRNPYVVHASMRRMVRTLLGAFALQAWDEDEVEALVLELYPKLMRRFDAGAGALAPGRVAWLRFEDFEADPVREVRRLARVLDLAELDARPERFESYMARVAGYRKRTQACDPATLRTVGRAWGEQIERFGYAPPGPGLRSVGEPG